MYMHPGRCLVLAAFLCLSAVVAVRGENTQNLGVGSLRMGVVQGVTESPERALDASLSLYQVSGIYGYEGLPEPAELDALIARWQAFVERCHSGGVSHVIGYECATSLVGDPVERTKFFEFYDRDWDQYIQTPGGNPLDWQQVDIEGNAIPSWYSSGPYIGYYAICHNNPAWREYHRLLIRIQLEAGFDGLFYDNPNKQPDGCYCVYCMDDFRSVLMQNGIDCGSASLDELRELTRLHARFFQESRLLASGKFIEEMKHYAASIRPDSLVYYNNSLNSPDALYANARQWGFSIWNWSAHQDIVMVEDAMSHPRREKTADVPPIRGYRQVVDDTVIVEYASAYRMLHVLAGGRPVSATSTVGGIYLNPPAMMQLGMAEAASTNAIYVVWPIWPVSEDSYNRPVARYNDWLSRHRGIYTGTRPVLDASLFLSLRAWQDTAHCESYELATRLTASNIQYQMVTERHLDVLDPEDSPVLIMPDSSTLPGAESESLSRYTGRGGVVLRVPADVEPGVLVAELTRLSSPRLRIEGSPFVRGFLYSRDDDLVLHLVNYDVLRELAPRTEPQTEEAKRVAQSFPDILRPSTAVVTDQENVRVTIRPGPSWRPGRATMLGPDGDDDAEMALDMEFTGDHLAVTIPRIHVYTVLHIEGRQ